MALPRTPFARPRAKPLPLPGHAFATTEESYGVPSWVTVPSGPESSVESLSTPYGQQMRLVAGVPAASFSDLAPSATDPFFHGGSSRDLTQKSSAAVTADGCYQFSDTPGGWVSWKLKYDFTPADLRLFRFLVVEPAGQMELHVGAGDRGVVWTAVLALPSPREASAVLDVPLLGSDGWLLVGPAGEILGEGLTWQQVLDTPTGENGRLFGDLQLDYPAHPDESFRPGYGYGLRLVHVSGAGPCVGAFELGWFWNSMGAEYFFTRVFAREPGVPALGSR